MYVSPMHPGEVLSAEKSTVSKLTVSPHTGKENLILFLLTHP